MRTRTPVTIGVDVGTTGAKAVVVDEQGRVRAEAGEEYPTTYVGGTGAEQDPDDWWGATVRCVRTVLEASGVAGSDVAAVGVSSQAPTVVLVDRAGRPVRPALLWMDRRGQEVCRARTPDGAAEVVARTGNRLDAYFAAPKLAWLLAAEPDVRHAASAVLMANGYVVHRLTGRLSMDSGHVGLTLLADLDTQEWAPDLVADWGIPPGWLPDPVHPATAVGEVTAEAARTTGLLAGTPVVAGLVDGVAAGLDAGLAQHGDVCEMTGQSTVVNAAFEVDRLDRAGLGTLSVLPYPVPGHLLVYGSMVATGGILRWFRDEFGAEGEAFANLDELAGTAPVGSGGLVLLPYFLGERSPIWDAHARGALVGLSMGSRRADVVRAILEGTAYGLAHNLEELARLGLRPRALRSVGGGARGRTWNQIKADVTGLPVDVAAQAHGAPAGVALLAAAGAGLVTDLVAEVRKRAAGTATVTRYEPDPRRHADYQGYYAVYRGLYPALRRAYDELAALRASSSSSCC